MKRIRLGGKRGGHALVDNAQHARLSQHGWSQDYHGYPCARVGGKTAWMHWLILKAPSGMVTDHINGNKLDNRRANLRIVDYSENSRNVIKANNRLGVRGVWFDKRTGRFCAAIHKSGKRTWCGRHDTAAGARAAYDRGLGR